MRKKGADARHSLLELPDGEEVIDFYHAWPGILELSTLAVSDLLGDTTMPEARVPSSRNFRHVASLKTTREWRK